MKLPNIKPVWIFLGIIVTSILLLMVLSSVSQSLQQKTSPVVSPTKPQRVFTTLTAVSSAQEINVGDSITIEIHIATGDNTVTLTQLSLGYDPKLLAIDKITNGTFFDKPFEYANKIDSKKGEITYASGSMSGKKGTGIIAVIHAKALTKTIGEGEELTIKNTSLVAETDNPDSVLKSMKGAQFVIR